MSDEKRRLILKEILSNKQRVRPGEAVVPSDWFSDDSHYVSLAKSVQTFGVNINIKYAYKGENEACTMIIKDKGRHVFYTTFRWQDLLDVFERADNRVRHYIFGKYNCALVSKSDSRTISKI